MVCILQFMHEKLQRIMKKKKKLFINNLLYITQASPIYSTYPNPHLSTYTVREKLSLTEL